jgi:hypothetical protein
LFCVAFACAVEDEEVARWSKVGILIWPVQLRI